jgi:predicted RNA methylase
LGGFLTFVERVMEIAKLKVKPICEQMVGGNGEAITVAWVDNYSMGKIYEWVDQRMVPVRDAASRLKKAKQAAEDSNDGVGISVDNPPH